MKIKDMKIGSFYDYYYCIGEESRMIFQVLAINPGSITVKIFKDPENPLSEIKEVTYFDEVHEWAILDGVSEIPDNKIYLEVKQ